MLRTLQLLCELSAARKLQYSHMRGNDASGKKLVEHGTQTDIEPSKPVVAKNKVGRPRKVCEILNIKDHRKS